MKKARIAVIGAGWWGTQGHIEPLTHEPQAELVAIYSRTEEKARQRAGQHGIGRYYTDYRRLIDECALDGVVIATTPNVHYEQARYALERGLHVLIEKPFVLRADQADDLGRLAREKGRILSVCHPLLYQPVMELARQRLRDELGRILVVSASFAQRVLDLYRGDVPAMFRWVRDKEYPLPNAASYADPAIAGGGEGHTQASHVVGAVLWMTDLAPQSVFAYMDPLDTPLDVVDAMAVRFSGGALGTITANGALPGGTYANRMHFEGEGGCLQVDVTAYGSTRVQMAAGSKRWAHEVPHEIDTNAALARNFTRAILGEEEMRIGMDVALNEVRLLDAAYRSAADGLPVTL